MAGTYKECQPFLPLSSTVLFARFATVKCPHKTPRKIRVKLVGYPYCKLLHKDYKRNDTGFVFTNVFGEHLKSTLSIRTLKRL